MEEKNDKTKVITAEAVPALDDDVAKQRAHLAKLRQTSEKLAEEAKVAKEASSAATMAAESKSEAGVPSTASAEEPWGSKNCVCGCVTVCETVW